MSDTIFLDRGELKLDIRTMDVDAWTRRHEIVGATLVGNPWVLLHDLDLHLLPDWARVGDDLVEIGPYILRRTQHFDPLRGSYYWFVVGQGEWFMLYWRVMRVLDGIWRRLLMTLAVWGLAEWPELGGVPRWAHVVRRWQKPRKEPSRVND